jgi:plastocyanin
MARRLFPVTLAALVAGVATAVMKPTPAGRFHPGRRNSWTGRAAPGNGGGLRVMSPNSGVCHARAPDRRSVVYLDPAPRAAFDTRDEARPRMDQRDETFVPHVLPIVVGTTVDFPNNDHTYHNVFSLSKTKTFDLGRYAVGRSKSVRFDRPGIVRVFCDIHSHMSAFIIVFAHRYFALADIDGAYRLESVPPGTYTVVAWNESAPLESRRVVVPDAGAKSSEFRARRR